MHLQVGRRRFVLVDSSTMGEERREFQTLMHSGASFARAVGADFFADGIMLLRAVHCNSLRSVVNLPQCYNLLQDSLQACVQHALLTASTACSYCCWWCAAAVAAALLLLQPLQA